MIDQIKIGFCIAYDWEYLRISLPLVYESASVICISFDQDQISWAGNKFYLDEKALNEFIHDLDKDNKVKVYKDDFHLSNLSPMENEVRQRKKISEFLGEGGWHLQLDTDEYFIDFEGFASYLRKLRPSRPVNVVCPWYIMFKQVKEGFLFVQSKTPEYIPVATNKPEYHFGRSNGHFNIKTNFLILHQSWARSKEEVLQKIQNWGHKNDFDVMKYFELWETLDTNNYADLRNFHPVEPEVWERLELVTESDVALLIKRLRMNPPNRVPQRQLARENSVWYSRIASLVKKLRG